MEELFSQPSSPRNILRKFVNTCGTEKWTQVQWFSDDITEKSRLPWLDLKLPWTVPHEGMLNEARAVRHLMVSHRERDEMGGYGHLGWKSLCLHGLSPFQTHCHTQYGFDDEDAYSTVPYHWTEVAERCPITTSFLKNFGYMHFQRVRFMLLEPGGYILPHRDSKISNLWAVNLALNNPPGCEFYMNGFGTLPFAPGRALKLDLSNEHAVWNNSHEDRFHLIIHGRIDDRIWNPIFRNSRDEMRKKHL